MNGKIGFLFSQIKEKKRQLKGALRQKELFVKAPSLKPFKSMNLKT